MLYTAMQAAGAYVTYVPVDGAEHSFILKYNTPQAQQALDIIDEFLTRVPGNI